MTQRDRMKNDLNHEPVRHTTPRIATVIIRYYILDRQEN